jgi:ATP-dependent RNA helicase DeaD
MSNPFETLGLRPELVQVTLELGYEEPTPIQTRAIPALLEGRDVLGQAQTGTGKTAAFALPMLNGMDFQARGVQTLVLVPTRELATQVSEAIFQYGKHLGVRVLPIYGGQSYTRQISRLERGVHVVVGTPGRLLDLIEKRALDLSTVNYLVLDEADEMLDMGFFEDVENIVSNTPAERQTALFSATMPAEIRRLAENYMHEPVTVTIQQKTMTVPQTEQRYYLVHENSKLAALCRLLEVEDMTSTLVFTRTKMGAAELAETLLNRGYSAEALHGDLTQDVREIVLRRFRGGHLKILVATDVVARGVDIEGVSHVINYDAPYDSEDYVHRIGRTGRAGRSGIAITLITPREQRRIKMIESFTKQQIPHAKMPGTDEVYARRDQLFVEKLDTAMKGDDLGHDLKLARQLVESGCDPIEVAAAAMRLARAAEARRPVEDVREARPGDDRPRNSFDRPRRGMGGKPAGRQPEGKFEPGMVRLLLDVGKSHGIRPADVVGTIASEAGIPGRAIGAIDIRTHQTFVDVKDIHVDKVLNQMGRGGKFMRGHAIKLVRAIK